jgi:hypothetical protein
MCPAKIEACQNLPVKMWAKVLGQNVAVKRLVPINFMPKLFWLA